MNHSNDLENRLRDAIMDVRAIDVHSHVPAAAPFARSLRDLLGYHYYTELAHSAGMDKEVIADERPDEEVIPGLLEGMESVNNTVQYSWMIELAQALFGFEDDRLTKDNWEPLAESVRRHAERPGRAREILDLSRLEKTFLTNEFDEELDGIDRDLFVPSLRADTLVFGLAGEGVRERLERASGETVTDAASLERAIGTLFDKFRAHGALSAAISLPPRFYAPALDRIAYDAALKKALSGEEMNETESAAVHVGTLYAVADACRRSRLPFQVMCGALRGAYPHGVHQGKDLPVAGDTLVGLLPLLNAFPDVTFCISVLSDSQIHELNSYGWILANVVVSGHWWYSTIPAYFARDLAARLQSVPKTKLIGYYSDMYKLEFGLAKFNMYRRTLARTLAREFVEPGYGTEDAAMEIAGLMLRGNAERVFGR